MYYVWHLVSKLQRYLFKNLTAPAVIFPHGVHMLGVGVWWMKRMYAMLIQL